MTAKRMPVCGPFQDLTKTVYLSMSTNYVVAEGSDMSESAYEQDRIAAFDERWRQEKETADKSNLEERLGAPYLAIHDRETAISAIAAPRPEG